MKERIVALGILVFAMVYTAGAIVLKVGTLAQPGAGQFPAAIALCLLAVSALHTWRTFRKTAEKGEGGTQTWFVPTGIAAVLVLYPVLLHALNFLLSTFIVLFVLFLLLRFKTVTVSFITALLTTLLSFVVFTVFLGVVLPTGGVEEFILKLMER